MFKFRKLFLLGGLIGVMLAAGCSDGEIGETGGVSASSPEMFEYAENEDGKIMITGLTEEGMKEEKLSVPKKIDGKGVMGIAEYAFRDCDALEELTLPDTITVIENNAFQGCGDLKGNVPMVSFYEQEDGTLCITGMTDENGAKALTIPDNILGKKVTSIQYDAFRECRIESVELPETLESIGSSAFRECYYLKEVILPEGLKTIEEKAFMKCIFLELAYIPSTVEEIPESCFEDCGNLLTVIIRDGVKSIGENAFRGTSKLHSLSIPASVEQISDSAFRRGIGVYYITIFTPAGSYAESFARLRGITVIPE